MKGMKTGIVAALMAMMLVGAVSAQQHFTPVQSTGIPYAIVVEAATWNSGPALQPGDEIGVFDGDLCVGAVVVDQFPLNLTAWEEDTQLGLEGFTPGELITWRVWDQSANEEQPALGQYSTGNATFGNGFGSSVSLNSSDFPVLLAVWSNEPTVPANGGQLVYGAHLWSTVGVTRTGLRFWTMLTPPGGTPQGPAFQYNFNLGPFMNISRGDLVQPIQGNWPAGVWTLTGYVGDYPVGTLVDSFTFTKLAGE